MDKTKFLSEIEKAIPEAVLQKQRFGKPGVLCLWIEKKRILEVCRFLKNDYGLEALENLSVIQVDDALVFSYFICRNPGAALLVLRVAVDLHGVSKKVKIASVQEIWETASLLENEIAELFGVEFVGLFATGQNVFSKRLSDSFLSDQEEKSRFPLRKDFRLQEGRDM